MSEPELVIMLKDPKTGNTWTSGLKWKELLSEIKAQEKRIDSAFEKIWETNQAVYKLQEITLQQLTDLCKPELMAYIEKTYPEKSFKDWDIRKDFEIRGFGWLAPGKAFDQLVKEGKLTYKRGWYKLTPKTESTITPKESKEAQ